MVLGAMVCSGGASASALELIEKSYGGSYAGPERVTSPPVVEPVALGHATIAKALHEWYAGEIRKGTRAIDRRLLKLKASAYNGFLARRKARALECASSLPEELQPEVEAFLTATEAEALDAAVRKLRKATEGQPREVLDCLDAVLVKLDGRGVLVGGLLWGRTEEGSEQLKPTLYNPGLVFILRPQVLTAWPGREDSALRVLDPRHGPWTVLLAHTHEEKVRIHGQEWKKVKTTSAADYLKRTNNGHFLLVDEEEKPLGWLDMDQAAFYDEAWAACADLSKPVFTSGFAAYVHGVWWNPRGISEAGGKGGMTRTRYQDSVYVLDFLRLVKVETGQAEGSIRDPYPELMRIRQLREIYQGKGSYKDELKLAAECRDHNHDLWRYYEELGTLGIHKGRLQYKMNSANVRTTLKKIYRLH
jgi:hypothetical protein